ncbi:MAG: LacI family DNA-binding transcriptional regulator [Microbacteriaceae bacterium]
MAQPTPPRRATIADVAERAGVSRSAVSKVFNSTGRISEATAERVRAAARDLHWSPSASAVALRRARSRTVGLVLHRSFAAPNAALIEGVESVLAPLHYGLLLYVADPATDDSARIYRMLADTKIADGVLLIDAIVDDPRFALLGELGLPAVLIGTARDHGPIPAIDADPPGAGVAESVELLARLGHRRVAYIGGPDDRVQAIVRREAYDEACRRLGLQSVATIATDYSATRAAEHTGRLLAGTERPTGILYGTDSMAIAGMRTAKRYGLEVPDDLSIIGFDGFEIGEWVEPQLTTVQRDREQRGRAAAALLLRMLGEDTPEYRLPRPDLIVRGSTGPAPRV